MCNLSLNLLIFDANQREGKTERIRNSKKMQAKYRGKTRRVKGITFKRCEVQSTIF